MKLEDFHTRTNITTKFILKNIDGKDSGQWFTVGGTESTEWRKARDARMRVRLSKSLNNEGITELDIDNDRDSASLLANMVYEWSFPDLFDRKLVEDFLYKTPYILDQLDSFISKRSTFFKKK